MYGNLSKWIYICDIDEYIITDNLNYFLNENDNYDSMYIPWIIYGTSYHINFPKNDLGVIRNFPLHDDKYSIYGKSIFKYKENQIIKCVHNQTY